jgi:hypothetical protein
MVQHCTEIIGAADNPRFGFKSHLGREQYPQKYQLEKVNLYYTCEVPPNSPLSRLEEDGSVFSQFE